MKKNIEKTKKFFLKQKPSWRHAAGQRFCLVAVNIGANRPKSWNSLNYIFFLNKKNSG